MFCFISWVSKIMCFVKWCVLLNVVVYSDIFWASQNVMFCEMSLCIWKLCVLLDFGGVSEIVFFVECCCVLMNVVCFVKCRCVF